MIMKNKKILNHLKIINNKFNNYMRYIMMKKKMKVQVVKNSNFLYEYIQIIYY